MPNLEKALITVRREDPAQPDVRVLIAELDRYLIGLYDPDENHLLDIESLRAPEVSFYVARLDGVALACGALRVIEPGVGEVKRVYAAPRARGRGFGRRILEALEDRARELALREIKLETGDRQPEALAAFKALGFTPSGPFGGYPQGVTSLFFVKSLRRS
jgi:putative acetyltransferase